MTPASVRMNVGPSGRDPPRLVVASLSDRLRVAGQASVLDSQTVRALFTQVRNYDRSKRIVGRKRHVAADTDGQLLIVTLTPANIRDSAGAQTILAAILKR